MSVAGGDGLGTNGGADRTSAEQPSSKMPTIPQVRLNLSCC